MPSGFLVLAMGRVSFDHPVTIFALVMLILLLAPILFERLRVPGMVGLIAAGLLLGPHGAGLFEADATFTLLGTVGLLYLMFLAGLEINADEFRANRAGSLVFGGLTFLIPMAVGTLLARQVIPGFGWKQSILLASMFASHTLVPHPIATRLGLSRHPAVVTTVGGTLITDTAALLVLAVIAQMTRTRLTPGFLALQLLLLAFFVAAVLRGVPRLGYWFFRRAEPDGAGEFTFVLAIVFLAALGALLTGVEAIIGAFLAGLALSPLVPEQGVLRNRLTFTGHALLIPFFLLKIGMLVNPAALARDWDGWRIALFMCATVTVTKGLAAWLAARHLRFSREEAGLIFGLSVNQAAATLAAVLVGCEIGLFDETVLNGTVLMILVSCTLGPWVTERAGRRLAERLAREPPSAGPTRAGGVVAAVGSPTGAERVLDLALLLAPPGAGRIHALHVVQEGTGEQQAIQQADRILGHAIVRGAAGGKAITGLTRLAPSPVQGIVHASRELRAAVIVMGWSDRSAARLYLFRSVLDRILAGTPERTVVVGRWPHAPGTSQRVRAVIPPLVDQQQGFDEALQLLCRIARHVGTRLEFITTESIQPRLRISLGRIPGKPDAGFTVCGRWEDVPGFLRQDLRGSDLVALISARRSQAAWGTELERLPSALARHFPRNNLLLLFPPVVPGNGGQQTGVPGEETVPQSGQIAERCAAQALLGWQGTLPEAVGVLLERGLVTKPAATTLTHALLANEATELLPGVVLLHTHADAVREVLLLLATGNIALPEPESPPARILLILVSPYHDPPERHLATLARLVRLLQRPGRVEALEAARSPDALAPLLAEAFG